MINYPIFSKSITALVFTTLFTVTVNAASQTKVPAQVPTTINLLKIILVIAGVMLVASFYIFFLIKGIQSQITKQKNINPNQHRAKSKDSFLLKEVHPANSIGRSHSPEFASLRSPANLLPGLLLMAFSIFG